MQQANERGPAPIFHQGEHIPVRTRADVEAIPGWTWDRALDCAALAYWSRCLKQDSPTFSANDILFETAEMDPDTPRNETVDEIVRRADRMRQEHWDTRWGRLARCQPTWRERVLRFLASGGLAWWRL